MSTTVTLAQLQELAAGGDAEAQFCLGGALFDQGQTEPALAWLARAAKAGHGRAELALALIHVDGQRVPRDLERARQWLASAAGRGLAEACYRLAELDGFAVFGSVDPVRVREQLLAGARGGFAPALRVLGFACAEHGRYQAARAWLDAAARAGDGPALHALGLCWLRGLGGESDAAAAALCFQEAARRGEYRSRVRLAELSGVTPAFRATAVPDPATLPEPGALPPEPAFQHLRDSPWLRQAAGAFNELECDYLINLAAHRVKPSMIVHPATGERQLDPIRTSAHFTVEPVLHDLIVENLEQRLARWAGLPALNGEFFSLLKYRPGEEYKLHNDYFNPALPGSAVSLADGGQRVQTLLVYLNDEFEGGGTRFPRAELNVVPKRGDLVHFHNVDATGQVNPDSLHAGLPVLSGEKWLASKWVRAESYPPRLRW